MLILWIIQYNTYQCWIPFPSWNPKSKLNPGLFGDLLQKVHAWTTISTNIVWWKKQAVAKLEVWSAILWVLLCLIAFVLYKGPFWDPNSIKQGYLYMTNSVQIKLLKHSQFWGCVCILQVFYTVSHCCSMLEFITCYVCKIKSNNSVIILPNQSILWEIFCIIILGPKPWRCLIWNIWKINDFLSTGRYLWSLFL